jgi:hypothetical protein
MKVTAYIARVASAVFLLSLITVPIASQSATFNQTPVLLEIVYGNSHPGIPISETHRVYADGRYVHEGMIVEQAKSGRSRKVFLKSEKQLEAEEVGELVRWAEQPDFLNAQQKQTVTLVLEYPDWFVITYRNKDKEKNVEVRNFSRGNEAQRAKVPPSVLKLLKWSVPYYFELAARKKN